MREDIEDILESAAAAEEASGEAAGAPADFVPPIKVFVHLARNKDAEEWRAA